MLLFGLPFNTKISLMSKIMSIAAIFLLKSYSIFVLYYYVDNVSIDRFVVYKINRYRMDIKTLFMVFCYMDDSSCKKYNY